MAATGIARTCAGSGRSEASAVADGRARGRGRYAEGEGRAGDNVAGGILTWTIASVGCCG